MSYIFSQQSFLIYLPIYSNLLTDILAPMSSYITKFSHTLFFAHPSIRATPLSSYPSPYITPFTCAMRNAKGKAVQKTNLPSKICASCARPFTWRKKWERCWDQVQCCSKRCSAQLKRDKRIGPSLE